MDDRARHFRIRRHEGARVGRVLVLGLVALAALLIWVRLRIVAQVPRSVLAEPQPAVVQEPRPGSSR
jgi:hypothetical protein